MQQPCGGTVRPPGAAEENTHLQTVAERKGKEGPGGCGTGSATARIAAKRLLGHRDVYEKKRGKGQAQERATGAERARRTAESGTD